MTQAEHLDPAAHLDPTAHRHDQVLRVCDVMTREVVCVGPRTTFQALVDLLLENDISGVPVVDADGSLLGMVTESDLITKEAYTQGRRRHLGLLRDHLAGRDPDWVRKSAARVAADLLSTEVDLVAPGDELGIAARLMLENNRKLLPVCEQGELVGIVSRHDLLKPFHRPDDRITEQIEAILRDPLCVPTGHEVMFTVAAGVVSLRGTTRFPSDAEVVASVVARVPGVVAVDNQLTARRPEPEVADKGLWPVEPDM